ncbi:MAG: hypothetical protein ACOCUU_02600 [Nanoarchaeota archaeon]
MCKICETKPVYEFTNQRKLCKRCFIKWFQKKFLFTIRKYKLIQNKEIILISKKRDFRNIVLKELMNLYIEKNPKARIISNKYQKHTKKATEKTTDIISYKIIKFILKNKPKKIREITPKYKKTILPLYLFLDKEVLLYAKLRNLKFNKTKIKETTQEQRIINNLEKKHPEIKRAIIQSGLKLS